MKIDAGSLLIGAAIAYFLFSEKSNSPYTRYPTGSVSQGGKVSGGQGLFLAKSYPNGVPGVAGIPYNSVGVPGVAGIMPYRGTSFYDTPPWVGGDTPQWKALVGEIPWNGYDRIFHPGKYRVIIPKS